MTLKSLSCPSCNAPLGFGAAQHRTLCLYCGSTIVLETNTAVPTASATPMLQPDVLDELKQYLLDGRHTEALRLYQERTGATDAEAAETLNTLSNQLTRRALLEQPISNLGLVSVAVVDTLGLAALIWAVPNGNWLVAVIAVAVMLLHTLAFARAMQARLVQELGQLAPARVQRVVRLGELKVSREPEPVQAVRVWLEVRPAGQAAFPVEKNLVMRRPSFDQLQPGLIIEVKYQGEQVFPTAPMKVLER